MSLEGTGLPNEGCDGHPDFEREWPGLTERLDALLAARHVAHCKRDDLIQETGLRLFTIWPQVRPDRPLWSLVATIALNVLRDEARRAEHAPLVGLVPDVVDSCNVERSGIARLELARVRRALGQLNAQQRHALLTAVSGHDGVTVTKMQRLRARRRLNAVLERATAGSIAVSWWRPVRRLRRLFGPGTASASAPAAGLLAAIALFTAAGTPPAPSPAQADRGAHNPRMESFEAINAARRRATRPVTRPSTSQTTAETRTRKVAGDSAPIEVEPAPYRVPVTDDTWVETSAGIGLLGLGINIADNGENLPVCLAGSLDLPLACGSSQKASEGPAGRVGAGIKYGDHEASADAHTLPE